MRVFITGITGTLGTALAKKFLEEGHEVAGCSRSEGRAAQWIAKYGKDIAHNLISTSDLVNLDGCRATEFLEKCDIVYHLAAMKHVDICEKEIDQCLCTNVLDTMEITSLCRKLSISCCLVSSDKACLPQGVYGASKLLAEKVALQNGAYVMRLGNLIGSSGSVFHLWRDAKTRGEPISLTDPEMTRFFIPVRTAVEYLMSSLLPSKVVIPGMQSVRMGDIASLFVKDLKGTGRRPGESQHQWIVAPGDRVLSITTSENDRKRTYHVLCESGEVCKFGMNSSNAPRWDLQELLNEVYHD